MVRLIATLSLVLGSTSAFAEDVLREITWQGAEGRLPAGQVLRSDRADEADAIGVENAGSNPVSVNVLTIKDPGITLASYAIVGRVRYEDVTGEGYLEMWSCFGDEGRFFSRTLGSSGPFRLLTGTCDWRRFVLPFYCKEGTAPPEELIVNVVLPGKGKVWLSPVRLVQYAPGEDPMAAAGQWLSDRSAGLVGGILGVTFGLMGALVGVLSSRGQGRAVVFGILRFWQIVGVLGLVIGVWALIRSQPYAVYYPLLLIGILGVTLGTSITRVARSRYDGLELRKMSAMDAL